MYDETEYDLDADWAGKDREWLEFEKPDNDYERELEDELHTRLNGLFPGKIQTSYPDLFRAEESHTILETAMHEAAKHELVDKIVPSLKQEVLRQVGERDLAKTEWSVRYEVFAPPPSKIGSQERFDLSVTVLVVEGPIDPDHA